MKRRLSSWLPRSDYWRDISWVASGTALAQIIGLLSMPVLTRLYTPADFAALNLFTQAVGFAMGVMTLRFEYAVTLPRRKVGALALWRLVLALALLGTLIGTLLMGWLAEPIAAWMGHPLAATALMMVPVTAGLMSIAVALQHAVQRDRQFRLTGSSEVISKAIYFIGALVGHAALSGALGLLWAVILGQMGKIVTLARWRQGFDQRPRKRGRPGRWHRLPWRAAKQHAAFSRSMVSSHLMLTLTGLIPALYLAQSFGAETLGQYALVVSSNYLPTALVGSAIGQVYYQRACERWAHGENFAALWRHTTMRLVLLGLPMFSALALVSPWLYPFVFGDEWQQAGVFSVILCLSSFLSFVTVPLDRSSLIVGVWRYLPLWNLARLLSTLAVVAVSERLGLSAIEFLVGLTLQMTMMYLVDMGMQRRYASRQPVPIQHRQDGGGQSNSV